MAIEADHYRENRAALKADPIIVEMARGVQQIPLGHLAHDVDSPRYEFMTAASREYEARGGTIQAHIGGPAEAILQLLQEWSA